MANGKTLEEIREILASDEKIAQPVMNRLILSMLAETYEAQKDAASKEDVRHAKLDADIKTISDKSILIWAEKNKPVAVLVGILIFALIVAGDSAQALVISAVARMLGVPYP